MSVEVKAKLDTGGPSADWVRSGRVGPGRVTGHILRNLCGSGRVADQRKFSEICVENMGSAVKS